MSTGGSYTAALDSLTAALGKLPGIGAKSAERLAHHLLKCPIEDALALANAIEQVRDRIRHCELCFHLTETEQPRCSICRDPRRDQSIVCIVEQPRDLLALERAGTFHGVYHVLLGKLAPLQGVGPEQLTVAQLLKRIEAGGIREVIMATNPNLEGDGTALLVANLLAEKEVVITRLARGLATGGALEFANKEMLADALLGRQKF